MTMTTPTSDFLPGLRPRIRPRPLKPPTPAQVALEAWRAAWAAKYGRPCSPVTPAGWTELKRHAKQLAEVAPDADERAELVRWYLATGDPYVCGREHPLRLLLAAWRLEDGLAFARRAVAERRKVERATLEAKTQADAVVVAQAPEKYGRWLLRLLGAGGREVGQKVIRAVDEDAARRIGTLWLFQAGAAAVTVEVSRA